MQCAALLAGLRRCEGGGQVALLLLLLLLPSCPISALHNEPKPGEKYNYQVPYQVASL